MNIMKKTIHTAVLLAGAVGFASGVSAETHYKPANFGFTGEGLLASMPEETRNMKDSAVVYCQSEISEKGAVVRSQCYDKQGRDALVSNTEKALEGLAFTPAEVDGKKVPVRMSYRVGYVPQNEGVSAVLIPNLGSMQAQYGRDYIAPQERLDVSDWYQRYSEQSWVRGDAFLGDGALSRVAATVSEKGETSMVRALDSERAYKRDVNLVKNAVKRSSFIPGFVDGRPVPMGYLAVVNYEQNGEAVSSR